MRKLSLALLVTAVGAGAFLLGRTTSTPSQPTAQTELESKTTLRPSPTATANVTPSQHRPVLRHFATMDEQGLPQQGVLGGTMVAGTVAFPKDFSRQSGHRFYVVGSDGHVLETWTYEVKSNGFWKFVEANDGYAPVDFQDHLDLYDVYLWRPAFYIPAEQNGLS